MIMALRFACVLGMSASLCLSQSTQKATVDFQREVRPILCDNCFQCPWPDCGTRRVALDLTGLPTTPAELDAFMKDASPGAYEHMVDRYLASPHYGEHRARYWLDAARYGDTHGIHVDNYREIWPFRDWVIQAYNRNQPYNEFATEQLAGDLLPNATL